MCLDKLYYNYYDKFVLKIIHRFCFVNFFFFFFFFFYSKNFYINSPWANAKSKVHAQQFGNLRRTAQIKSGKQEYKVLE